MSGCQMSWKLSDDIRRQTSGITPERIPESFLLEPVKSRVGPDEQAAAGDRGSGPGEVVELVLPDDRELGAVLDDPRGAVLVEKEDLAVVRPRGRVEPAAARIEALARIDRLARLRVGAHQQ